MILYAALKFFSKKTPPTNSTNRSASIVSTVRLACSNTENGESEDSLSNVKRGKNVRKSNL